MDEERARILKMLEEGKITAQEAERLLLALKGQPRADMSQDELRMRMRKFGLREMRRMPDIVGSVIQEAVEDGLSAAVRKQRFEFESKGRLLVRNVSGDTEISGWDKRTVLFDRDEGGLWKATEREGMIMAKVLSGDLRVNVPRSTELTANSVSGDLAVSGVEGKIEVKTVSGDVELRRDNGSVDVSTTSGDIKTRDLTGKCHIVTVSGDVDLGFAPDLSGIVETRSGDVQIWVPSGANLLLEAEIVVEGEISRDVKVPCEMIEERPDHLRLGFGKKENRLWVRCRNGDIRVGSYEPGREGEARDEEAAGEATESEPGETER